jgi:hypothetical protein
MCIVYETLVAMVHFFIYTIMYILLYINVDIIITLHFYVFRWNMKREHKKRVDQENIRLNNQSTISPTSDEEMRHGYNSSDDNNSSDE